MLLKAFNIVLAFPPVIKALIMQGAKLRLTASY